MDFGHTRAHIRAEFETRAVHAKRISDVLLNKSTQTHARDCFNQLACPVDANTVIPLCARIKHQWHIEPGFFA